MKITDYLVNSKDNAEILHNKVPEVDMRLFKSSVFYRQLVMDIVNYMDSLLSMTFEDSASLFGISAVKLGYSFAVIGYKCQGKHKFCINPKITKFSKETTETSTNCGALRLKQDIKVLRANLIDFEYYDLKGQRVLEENVGRYHGGFVVQHECDHCQGICITDREIQPEVKEKAA